MSALIDNKAETQAETGAPANPEFRSRHFLQSDPFDRQWRAEFLWLQTGISIRHADTVDVRFALTSEGEKDEKVVALPHAALLTLARAQGRELSDAWCMRLASAHLRQMIATWQDMDKPLVTLTAGELATAHEAVKRIEARLADRY